MAKRQQKQEQEVLRQDGGLCVTFVNSASPKRRTFSTYAELLAWAVRCGAVTAAEGERLERAAAEHPDAAAAVAGRALELRSCLGRIYSAVAAGKAPPAAALEELNAELSPALSARRLVAASSGCAWAWGDRGGDDLDRMLWPVLLSAADVLSYRDHLKVRQCTFEGCDLLFVDRSPGCRRKWCSMKACGGRAKSHRHYHRKVKPKREWQNAETERVARAFIENLPAILAGDAPEEL